MLEDLATVPVLIFCAHADEEAPYARLAMPFDKLQKRHGSGDSGLMLALRLARSQTKAKSTG